MSRAHVLSTEDIIRMKRFLKEGDYWEALGLAPGATMRRIATRTARLEAACQEDDEAKRWVRMARGDLEHRLPAHQAPAPGATTGGVTPSAWARSVATMDCRHKVLDVGRHHPGIPHSGTHQVSGLSATFGVVDLFGASVSVRAQLLPARISLGATAAQPVYLTSIRGDSVGCGSNGDCSASSLARGDWYTINQRRGIARP